MLVIRTLFALTRNRKSFQILSVPVQLLSYSRSLNKVIKTKPSEIQNKVFYWKTCSSTRQIGSVPSSADSGDWSETITSALS